MSHSQTLIERAEIAVHEALDLEESGDLAGALAALQRARKAIAFIPDGRLEEEQFAYSHERIDAAIAELRRQINESGGASVTTMPLRPTRG